jgi:branched-chain amino acid transport system permease protein
MYTGIAGALAALVAQFVSPDSFQVLLSIQFLVGMVVGGVATIAGAFPGAAFIVFVPNIAESISKAAPQAIYGVFLIGFMYLMPTGVVGVVRILGHRVKRLMVR